jgi:predicted RNA-binding Zn ribbon-like protein
VDPLPSWYPFDPSEDKPAPMPLLRVQAFLNTRDFDDDRDLLADPEEARIWLTSAGLLPEGAALSAGELQLAREVRDGLRSLVEGGGRLETLRELAEVRRPRLTVDEGGKLMLAPPRGKDLGVGLFELMLIVRAAQEDGTWSRLRACANPECRWVFYDRSRNQQGSWCEMAVCGNRLKNRRLRARQAGSTST